MHSLSLVVAAFAALTIAVPHPGHHALEHARLHKRAVEMPKPKRFAHPPLEARGTISYDGSCGSWSGMTCAAGYCCSSMGWCGNSAEACGAGCQEGYGSCGSSGAAPSSSAAPVSGAGVSPSAYQPPPASSSLPETSPPSVASPPPAETSGSSTAAPVATASSSSVSGAPRRTRSHRPRPHRSTTSTSLATVQPTTPSTSAYSPPAAPTTTTAPAAPTTAPAVPTTTYAPTSTSAAAAPTSYPSSGSGGSGKGNTYTFYQGNGSPAAGWPSESDWISFDDMWSANLEKLISISCTQFGTADNSDQESADVKSAIESISSETDVDPRYILAIIMQESKGCVRVPTTAYSHANPGLMQSNQGTGTCNNGGDIQNPCPQSEITQMVSDGTAGTTSGDGLKQLMAQCSASDAQKYYMAARMYNSGSVDASGDLGAGVATHCYCSDIANRLTGWTDASSTCTLD